MTDVISSKRNDWFGIIMLFLVMMLSGGNLLLSRSIMYGIVICGYIYFLVGHNAITKSSLSGLGGLFVFCLIFLSILHSTITNHYISNINAILKLFTGLLVYNYYVYKGYDAFVKDLSFLLKLFVILGVISLLFALVIPSLYTAFYATRDGVNRVFYHIGFILYICKTDIGFRLNGLFWEPGIFQIYLNIYLLMQGLFFKQKKWIILTLLLIFFTESTTGYIVTSIILLYMCILFLKQYKSFGYRIFIGGTFILAFIFIVLPSVVDNVNNKFSGEKVGSFYARQADMIASYEIVKEHPFIGIGTNVEDFKTERSFISNQGAFSGSDTTDRASANGLLSILYMYGFPFCILYIIGLFRQTMMPCPQLLGAIILLISILSEPLALTPFFLIFLFSGFKKTNYIRLCKH